MLLADIFGFWGWFWIIFFLIGIGQVFSGVIKGAETLAKDERVQETFWTIVWKSLGGK
jgi:F0F1-type ATP synthase assembly protein I